MVISLDAGKGATAKDKTKTKDCVGWCKIWLQI